MATELRLALRRAGRTVRISRPARWCFSQALIGGRRPGRRFSQVRAFADRLLSYDVLRAEERRATVDMLVELFFEVVEEWHLERFVEAGAKDARASVRASKLPSVVRAVAFEANPFTHRRFASSFTDTSVLYEHVALTDGALQATFHVRLDANARPIADGQGSLHARTDHESGHQEVTVRGVTLDGYFAPESERRSALWIDVEGALDIVLAGARRFLGGVDIILAEVEEYPYWHPDQWLRNDVDRFLEAQGLVPIARDQQSRHQYNVLYARRSRIDDVALQIAYRRWRQGTLRRHRTE